MAEQTWNPYREYDLLRREIDRAFEMFGGNGGSAWPFSRVSFLPGRSARAYPMMNLSEDDEALYIEALAPGVDPETLDIRLLRNQLSVSGEKRVLPGDLKSESYHRNERSAGRFVRTLNLPVDVDEGRITADYRNGLLLITLPKAEAAKPRQITVTMN